jgi:hypothetical protein
MDIIVDIQCLQLSNCNLDEENMILEALLTRFGKGNKILLDKVNY